MYKTHKICQTSNGATSVPVIVAFHAPASWWYIGRVDTGSNGLSPPTRSLCGHKMSYAAWNIGTKPCSPTQSHAGDRPSVMTSGELEIGDLKRQD